MGDNDALRALQAVVRGDSNLEENEPAIWEKVNAAWGAGVAVIGEPDEDVP